MTARPLFSTSAIDGAGKGDFFGQNEAGVRELLRQQGFAGTDIKPLRRGSGRTTETLQYLPRLRPDGDIGTGDQSREMNLIAGAMNLSPVISPLRL